MEIQNATLQKFSNNVQEMVDFVEANYEEIVPHNFTHPDYTIHLLNALLTSKNKMSRSVIQRLINVQKIGRNGEPEVLIEANLKKYNNMVNQNIWDQKDPKDATILALTTKLDFLESAFNISFKTHYKIGTWRWWGFQK